MIKDERISLDSLSTTYCGYFTIGTIDSYQYVNNINHWRGEDLFVILWEYSNDV